NMTRRVAVGDARKGFPRADPCERSYRTRLLPWVLGVGAVVRVRVQDLDLRNPTIDELIEPLPRHPVTLTSTPKRLQQFRTVAVRNVSMLSVLPGTPW